MGGRERDGGRTEGWWGRERDGGRTEGWWVAERGVEVGRRGGGGERGEVGMRGGGWERGGW